MTRFIIIDEDYRDHERQLLIEDRTGKYPVRSWWTLRDSKPGAAVGKAAPGPLPLDNWTEDQKRIALEQLSDESQAESSEPKPKDTRCYCDSHGHQRSEHPKRDCIVVGCCYGKPQAAPSVRAENAEAKVEARRKG